MAGSKGVALRGLPLRGVLHSGGRTSHVLVTPHGDRLVVHGDGDIAGVPLKRIRCDDAVLRRADKTDWRVVLSDVPPDSWPTGLPRQGVSRVAQRVVLAILALLGLAAGIAWLNRERIIIAAAPLIPHGVTAPMGRAYLATMGRPCDGGEGSAALARLTARLLPARGLPEPVTVSVVANPRVNAVALPGGYVVLYSGLIAQAKSADEVAAVLAHEIEHVAWQHANQAILRASGPAVIARTLGSDAGKLADLTVLKQGDGVAEAQADTGAVAVMKAAKVSTNGAVDFFRRQIAAGVDGGGFGDTHPSNAARAALYDKASTWWASPALEDADWQALQAICRS
ncbi:MAG: hypothetical protein DCF31_10455 [Alphaproteobacteria bacterium]|nr:MAG: hypothetical protein DCF31_10455 [Alphaproteobacteria bacterium]